MELSKIDIQEIRKIIESGLQREFANGLSEADSILTAWKTNLKSNRDVYHQLYKHIMDFDKHISRRYDRLSGAIIYSSSLVNYQMVL